VAQDTKFVTCKHCDTQLVVHHEDGAAFTDVVEAAKRVEKSAKAIQSHVEELAEQNERLLLQGEIERLDREWGERRQTLMTRREDGELRVVTRSQAWMVGFAAPLIALPLLAPMFVGSNIQLPTFLWLVALGFMALLLFLAFRMHAQAVAYEEALARHESERDALVAQLDALGGVKRRRRS
jgi:hypothetical protein